MDLIRSLSPTDAPPIVIRRSRLFIFVIFFIIEALLSLHIPKSITFAPKLSINGFKAIELDEII